MADGPIGEAFVEILPLSDEAKFEAALEKIGTIIGSKVGEAFNKTTTAANKATGKVKDLGEAGENSGKKIKHGQEEAASGFHRATLALEKYEERAKHGESAFERLGKRIVEAFSIYAAAEFVKKSVEVAEAFERTNRVVEQAIRTTGGAAGLTIKQFDELGSKMALTDGIAETVINNANQQLFAFTNIRNLAGKGNDIFNRAAGAVQDISVRTGLGAIQIARSLGKALEDPAKATLVLRRASVILTASQKDQIDTFEKSNNVLGAQKVVLDALQAKFGGAAAAAADPLKQLAVASDQIKRSLGQALIPTIDKFALLIVNHQPQIQSFVTTVGEKLQEAIKAVTPFFTEAAHAIGDFYHFLQDSGILKVAIPLILTFAASFKALKEVMLVLKPVIALVAGALEFNPVTVGIVAISALVAGLVYAYHHSERFRNMVNHVSEVLRDKLNKFLTKAKDIIVHDVIPALTHLWTMFQKNVLPVLEKVGKFLVEYIVVEFRVLYALIKDVGIPVFQLMVYIWEKTVLPVLNTMWDIFKNYLLPVISAFIDFIVHKVIPAMVNMVDVFISGFKAIIGAAAAVAGALGFDGLQAKLNAVKDGVQKFKDDLDAIAANPINFSIGFTVDAHRLPDAVRAAGDAAVAAAQKNAPHGALSQGDLAEIRRQAEAAEAARIAAAKKAADAANNKGDEPLGPKPPIDPTGASTKTAKVHVKVHADLVELLRQSNATLVAALTKGTAAASKALSSIKAKIKSTLKGTLDEGFTVKALALLERQRTLLGLLAGAYEKVTKQVAGLKSHLAELKKAADEFKASVISALEQTASVDTYLQSRVSGGSAHSFERFLEKQLKKLTAFRASLATLLQRGVDPAFVQGLAAAGLADAKFASKLAKAPTADLSKIKSLETQLTGLQKSVADTAGRKLQEAVNRTNLELSRETLVQTKMLKTMEGLAHSIVTGLAAVFGVKNVPKFAQGGWTSGPSIAGEAGRELVLSMRAQDRRRSEALLSQSPFGLGGGRGIHVTNNIQAAPGMDEMSLAHRLSVSIAQQVR